MNSETKPVSFALNGHPDENQLLLALERELAPEEALQVEQHLGNCWSCRARAEEMQRGILAFVEYREKRYLPSLAVPPDDYSGFRRRLGNVVGEHAPVGFLIRLWRKIIVPFAALGQVRWVSAGAFAMACVLFWTEVLNPPVVSANELLTRAVAAQNPSAPSTTDTRLRVAQQTVQIRSGNQTVIRSFEWTIGGPIRQARWATQSNPLDWNAPLTAAGFADWRDSLHQKSDKVKRSDNLLTLDTTTGQGLIREASIIVSSSDFHPVAQHLRFADDRQLDFTEIGFQIKEQPRTKDKPARTDIAPVRAAIAPKAQSLPSKSELDETELQLRYLLFTQQWDLGEDLIFGRAPGRVTLSGTVSSAEREEAMRTALRKTPDIQLTITAPGAANTPPSIAINQSDRKARPSLSIPLLGDQLEKRFTSREERLAFVDRCLNASDTTLSHAWSLKTLAARYSESEEHLLKPESQAKLHEMLRAHLAQVRRGNAELGRLMDALLASSASTYQAAPLHWQAGIRSLFTQVQQQDELVASLLVRTQGAQDLATASEKAVLTHRKIETLVAAADRLISGDGVQ